MTKDLAGDPLSSPPSSDGPEQVSTGIAGLDVVLRGGLPAGHAYLLQGDHGTGKTTLGLQFCREGAARGERVLYLSTCESEADLLKISGAHGWDLDGVEFHYHDPRILLGEDPEQSIFRPAEVELPRTLEALESAIDRVDPQRLVLDSLTELRLLAGDPRWFRRQLLTLRDNLARRRCTALFCDDQPLQQPGQSIVHGVLCLEQVALDYGPDRRRLRVGKIRGQDFKSGYHDFRILGGGLEVYPRLVAAEHRRSALPGTMSCGLPVLDRMLGGGGVDRSTATLLMGPAGTGKSTVASQIAVAGAQRGERTAIYVFDERIRTLMARARGLGLDLEEQVDRGLVELQQIDPAEMTPGEFSHLVHRAVRDRGVELVVIDSLAGYVHAMPDERLLSLHLHELLAFLSEHEVSTLMVMAQHGLGGIQRQAPFDLSYIADSVLLFHLFEHGGEIRKAVSVYKRRGGAHETSLRELRLGEDGIQIGDPLRGVPGILGSGAVPVGGDPFGEGGGG